MRHVIVRFTVLLALTLGVVCLSHQSVKASERIEADAMIPEAQFESLASNGEEMREVRHPEDEPTQLKEDEIIYLSQIEGSAVSGIDQDGIDVDLTSGTSKYNSAGNELEQEFASQVAENDVTEEREEDASVESSIDQSEVSLDVTEETAEHEAIDKPVDEETDVSEESVDEEIDVSEESVDEETDVSEESADEEIDVSEESVDEETDISEESEEADINTEKFVLNAKDDQTAVGELNINRTSKTRTMSSTETEVKSESGSGQMTAPKNPDYDSSLPRLSVNNDVPLQVFQDIQLRTDLPQSVNSAYYYHYINRSNGQTFFLTKTKNPVFTHRFLNPDNYWWITVIYDQNHDTYKTKLNLKIEDNRPTIKPYIGPVHPLHTDIETQYGFSVTGGGRIQKTSLDLIRNGGSYVSMTKNNNSVLWNIKDADFYVYQVTVYDEAGRKWKSQINLNLINRPDAPIIESFVHNKSTFKEDFDFRQNGEVTANSPVGSPLQYDYWLSTNGAEPVKIAWQNIEHIAYDFTTEGKYRMFAVVRDAQYRYDVASNNYVVAPNLPEVELFFVNQTQYEDTEKMLLVTRIKPNTGRGDLTYQYATYSWTEGRQTLGTFNTPNHWFTVKDRNVAAFQVIVKDAYGRQAKDHFFRVSLPGAFSGIDGSVSASGRRGVVSLSWGDQLIPSGYLVLKDNYFVEDIKATLYDDTNFSEVRAYTYRIVPYISFTGQSYYRTPENQRVAAFKVFESVSATPRPPSALDMTVEEIKAMTLDEIRMVYGKTRDTVIAIAKHSVNRIEYKFGNKRIPGKSGYDAVPWDGLQCSGYVEWVFNAAGFTDRELGRWQWTGSMMLDTVDINESNLVPGDLGFVNYAGSHANHVGIYMGRDGNGNKLWAHLPSPGSWSNIDTAPGSWFTYFKRPRMWA